MLERYYLRPQCIDRTRACWLAEPIERYVSWLSERGYAARSIFHRVPMLVHFARFAEVRGAKSFDDLPAQVRPFAEDWLKQRGGNCRDEVARRRVFGAARSPVEQMLQLVLPEYAPGSARRDRPAPEPFYEHAPQFFSYLRDERGLKESSITHYRGSLRAFESYCQEHRISAFAGISSVVLSSFITTHAPHLSSTGRRDLCCTLKVFLKYLFREGIVARDLAESVGAPYAYRLAEIPRSISWEEVRRMLEAVERRTATGKRDYAILLLLVTYGLRAREVAALTLEDIDWKRERLRIPERKAGHSTAFPLSPLVGNAIVEYLQHGRPETNDRRLFFGATAPWRPLERNAVGQRASYYLHKAGIPVARPGSHTLRHTCVQRLVDAEFHFKTIGDYVGHANPASTQIYTKVAVAALREVAMGDGEAIL
jgi:integrase/recombinase XerD